MNQKIIIGIVYIKIEPRNADFIRSIFVNSVSNHNALTALLAVSAGRKWRRMFLLCESWECSYCGQYFQPIDFTFHLIKRNAILDLLRPFLNLSVTDKYQCQCINESRWANGGVAYD